MKLNELETLVKFISEPIKTYVFSLLNPIKNSIKSLEDRLSDSEKIDIDNIALTAASLIDKPVDGKDGIDGKDGKSFLEQLPSLGYKSVDEFINSLKGKDGKNGKDGQNGRDGTNGINGKSAYGIAVDLGFVGSESKWISSLKGLNGKNGINGKDGVNGKDGKDGQNGRDGINGKSFLEQLSELGFENAEHFIKSIKGTDGINGKDGKDGKDGQNGRDGTNGINGKSAYDIAVDLGFVGSESKWISSLKGLDGKDGENGKNGLDGKNGKDGIDGKDGENGKNGINGTDGKDALDIEILPDIDINKQYPRGTYATHNGGLWRSHQSTKGLRGWECIVKGISDIDIKQIDERNFSIKITNSDNQLIEKAFSLPVMIYRGVYKEGTHYSKGDTVTWGGSLWHCNQDTQVKPDNVETKHWTLAAKRGRDAR